MQQNQAMNPTDSARELLADLVSLPTLPGHEQPAIDRMAKWFAEQGLTTRRVPIPDSIKQDEGYSFGDAPLDYTDRHNLVAELPGAGGGRSLILCSHVDVVPAPDWPEAFTPRVEGERLYGRGACDAKGQVVALALAIKLLRDRGVPLRGTVYGHVVVEEELGGNGALAMMLAGERAEAALVLEGTQLHIHPANRGALWFRLRVEGRSLHMGRRHEGINAIEQVMPLIAALQAYELRLIDESRNQPQFERYANPVQVNFGTLQAGHWPSMVAGEAVLEGGVGFLPNKPMRAIKQELRAVIDSAADEWTRGHYTLDFPKLHNDAYAGDPQHPFVQTLHRAATAHGAASAVFGWNVSCDARLYHHRGGMPTVVFGPGSIAVAHSNAEFIELDELVRASEIIAAAAAEWCR